MQSKSVERNTWITVALALLAISFGSIFARLAGWPPLVMAFSRCFIAAVFLTAVVRVRRLPKPVISKNNQKLLLLAGVLLAAHLGLWIASLNHTTVSASVLLVETVPIWAALMNWALRIDPLGAKSWIGVAISVVGAGVIATSGGQGSGALFGNLLALAGAVTFAGTMVIGRVILRTMDSYFYIQRLYSIAAAALVVPAILSGPTAEMMPLKTLPWLLAMCFGSQVIGHTLVNRALAVLPPTAVSIALLSETIFATLWAKLIFSEQPAPVFFIGALLICVGIVLAVTDKQPLLTMPTQTTS